MFLGDRAPIRDDDRVLEVGGRGGGSVANRGNSRCKGPEVGAPGSTGGWGRGGYLQAPKAGPWPSVATLHQTVEASG